MRGSDEASGSLFSYVDLEQRIPSWHPLRKIKQVVNEALASLDEEFDPLYAMGGVVAQINVRAEGPFSRGLSGDGLDLCPAEGREAVHDSDADLDFSGLTVGIS